MDFPLRRLAIPHDHMLAEVAALPLASEEAFRNGLVVLHPHLSDEARTNALWREAERILTRSFPSVSLDDLTNLRDWVWFAGSDEGPRQPVPLKKYARRVADLWTGIADEAAGSPRLLGARARRRDRWFAFALPRGLLGGPEPPPMPARLEQALEEEGFAEVHLHAGAAMEFSLLWAAAARSVAVVPPRRDGFRAPGAAFDEGAGIAGWLVRVMVVRYVLAGYLTRAGGSEKILRWATKEFRWLGTRHLSSLIAVLDEVNVGQMHANVAYEEAINLYRMLVAPCGTRQYHDRKQVLQGDPIAVFFQGSADFPDGRFHEAARSHLDSLERRSQQSDGDDAFLRLYWQFVRIQTIFYRHVVQRPMTPGLMWFIRTYHHPDPVKKMVSWMLQVREARRSSGEGRGLSSLEVRTSPKETVALNLAHVKAIADLASEAPLHWGDEKRERRGTKGRPFELGLVLHFVKDRGKDWRIGTPSAFWEGSSAMPEIRWRFTPIPRFRYARYYREQRRKAMAVGELILRHPWALHFLRGIDFCTDEQGVPTWVLAPLFRYLRAASERARTYLGQEGIEVRQLGLTAHVGEDFIYLTSGLRRIGEAIDHLGFSEGDRIGHGMALGLDPETWANESGPVLVPREDRLFDLAWERNCLLEDDSVGPTNRLSRIEHQIREQFLWVFQRHPVDLDVINRFVAFLHDGEQLQKVEFPHDLHRYPAWGGSRLDREAYEILFLYLTDPDVFRRGRELFQVDPIPEIEAIQSLQSSLCSRLGHLGIAVEVNPSSNLLIGNLGRLEDHPIFRLNPIERASEDAAAGRDGHPYAPPRVSVCVGSDDPLTFACDLPREFALLHDAMVSTDVSSESAIRWIQAVMQVGRQSRFTRSPVVDVERTTVVGLGRGLAPVP